MGPPMLATITKTASPRHPNRRAMRQLSLWAGDRDGYPVIVERLLVAMR
jgi:hypothetical protein